MTAEIKSLTRPTVNLKHEFAQHICRAVICLDFTSNSSLETSTHHIDLVEYRATNVQQWPHKITTFVLNHALPKAFTTTPPVAKKTKDRNLVAYFNVILFYIEISVVKGFYFNEIQFLSQKKKKVY